MSKKYELKEKYFQIERQLVKLAFNNGISRDQLINNLDLIETFQRNMAYNLFEEKLSILKEMKAFLASKKKAVAAKKVVNINHFRMLKWY